MEKRLTAPVLFEERPAGNGKRIGVATLNVEKTLNALSLEMIVLLGNHFLEWAVDPSVALVVLLGAGDKAFCAGGDLRSLHTSMLQHHSSPQRNDIRANAYALEFFAREYRLDYLIHTYPKPVLCWGHGIVMGGGVGLMAGASHRVVTERSKIAMPEISVGLYPDVGGTWLLGRMPGHSGLFLALTGAPLAATDAIFVGMADYALDHAAQSAVMDALAETPWDDDRRRNEVRLADILRSHASMLSDHLAGPLRSNFDRIEHVCCFPRLMDIIDAIVGIASDDPWLSQAAAVLAAGSPTSAALAFALQKRTRHLSLADVFRIELVVSLHCAAKGDFAEGIRALLIDKDRRPRWQPPNHTEVTQARTDSYFASPWRKGEGPLADLGVQMRH
jgi:enoyl-CoA hydratase/carnithine racemase